LRSIYAYNRDSGPKRIYTASLINTLMRKAQITLFIIIGILIIIVGGIAFWLLAGQAQKNPDILGTIQLQTQADIVKNYVEKCLFDVSVRGIYLITSQGGYIDPEYNAYYGDYDQVEWVRSGELKIPYWYYGGVDISPSLNQVETKLGRYILVEGENCTNVESIQSLTGTKIIKPATTYQETFFDTSKEKTNISVSINERDVSVRYYFPITLKRNDSEITVKEYYAYIPFAIGLDFASAKEIVGKISTAGSGGYNLEPDCLKYARGGYTNVFPFKSRILLIDYEPYFNPTFGRSLKFQYRYSGKIVYGYCSG
jgi:hypothetical protein